MWPRFIRNRFNRKIRDNRKAVERAILPVIEGMEERTLFSFVAPISVAPGTSPASVLVADFNGDGVKDVAAINSTTASVNVMLGNGDGTFQAPIASTVGAGSKMTAADFNHDGKMDLVINQGYSLELMHGNGDGSLAYGGTYYVGAYANDVESGDVNHDGFDDLVTASTSYGGTTQLLLNDGAGGFLPTRNLAIGPTGQSIEIGDVNGDGNADLVEQGGYNASVLIGVGDGTFRSTPYISLGSLPQDMHLGDFNHDGMADLAITSCSGVSIFAGNATGTYASPTSINIGSAGKIAIGDVNGDGNNDIVANNGLVVLGRGDGGFYVPTAYGAPAGGAMALGDLNGDGGLDAVSAAGAGAGVNISLNGNNDTALLAGATQFAVSAPDNATAGAAFPVTVSALDADGNVITGFQGSVAIIGAAGTQPVYYTFTAADNGVHTIPSAAKFFTAGAASYSVMSPFLPTATGSINVLGAAAARFTVTAQASSVAGDSASVTVSALDAYGNSTSGYLGTVHFTSSDVQAGLPSDYTFTLADNGSHTFDVVLKTAGAQSITARDTAMVSVAGTSAAVTVTPSVAASLSLSGGGGYIGSVNAVAISARDAYGNLATSYNGIVHLTSSDAASTTSADAALINGVGTFTVTPMTLGAQTLSASDVETGALAGSEDITVTPGWGARFVATALPTSTVAGQTQSTTLTVYDAFGDVSTVFTGYVAVSGTDPRSFSYVYFSAADAGVKTIPVTLYTAGTQAVTIYDYSNPGVTTTQTGINVTAAAAASISVSPLIGGVAGTSQNVTVSARDLYGNVATSYRGTITFASSDSQAALPADYTFTAADAGSHTFSVTFKSASGQDITITDPTTTPAINPTPVYYITTSPTSMTYYQRDILITPAALSTFSFKAASISNTTAGTTIPVEVSATDAYGNAITNYTGTVKFGSSDIQAGLPASYTFTYADAGVHTFNITLKTAGSQSVTVTDAAGITGTLSTTIKAAAASRIAISTANSATAGTAQTVTLSVTDAYGNAVSNYTGTVHFASSDAQAILPANYSFTNKDGGTHTFSVTLKTPGSQSITANDTVNTAISATQSGIAVTAPAAAPVASLSVAGLTATTAGTARSFTVTAKDAAGNIVTGYTGTITFSSSDVKAGLPPSYTFTAADAGVHTFSATLKTAGTQSVTATDSAKGIVASQGGIVVSPGAATQFVFSTPVSVTQGNGFKFTVTALDAYGNIATGYRGKVTLTSTDAKGGSSTTTFSSSDNGVHTFSYTFSTLGTQTLKLVDTANAALLGSANVSVLAK